ncbi:transposase [Acidihalobacter yilgarnensis]|uniref:Transposase n=1 Tax=Acidihalobacter yilgarnensis TaxID=2819280 RepID=A0A1D8IML5_9GAMM|nr:RNA-guided endonuclease TnpB family protein [Acidihalobacter yilgarnensis]AOU97716.1 transposase [Acidihalobacter yilgarnensis]
MQIGNRFRCYPTKAQEKILLQWIGCQRHIYNAKVREDQYFRRFACKSLQHVGQCVPMDQQYAQFKTELTPWLSDVPSVVLRNGAVLWKQAYGRYFSKLGGRPVIHRRHGKQSVWITSELFEFVPMVDAETGEITGHQLHLGTQKFPVGIIAFKAHKEYRLPASLHLSIHAGRWHVSFNYDDGMPEPTDRETTDYLTQFDESELRAMTVGLDRGVALPLAGSDLQKFDFSDIQKQRLAAQERHKKRWQRRQARRTKGSAGWFQAKRKVARYQRYGGDVRRDVAHKTSCTLANDPRYKLFAFEALKVTNMTRRAKPKQDERGRWIKNGASAKSGLNKSILASTWGQTKIYLQYKARRQGKLVIEVPPFYSSQECAACGHVHPDNRISQSEFVCQRCGNTDHADHNAANVIALRGVRQLLSGKCVRKEKKRCAIKRNKVGAEGSEPVAGTQSTPGKTVVSRMGGNTRVLWSLTQETPATNPSGI